MATKTKITGTYKPKARNWHALNALTRKVWKRGNPKKEASRKACRGRVRPE